MQFDSQAGLPSTLPSASQSATWSASICSAQEERGRVSFCSFGRSRGPKGMRHSFAENALPRATDEMPHGLAEILGSPRMRTAVLRSAGRAHSSNRVATVAWALAVIRGRSEVGGRRSRESFSEESAREIEGEDGRERGRQADRRAQRPIRGRASRRRSDIPTSSSTDATDGHRAAMPPK